jgi:hypothetical protein
MLGRLMNFILTHCVNPLTRQAFMKNPDTSCVAALVNGTTIDGGLRLVLSHLWASENVKQYRTPH